MFDTMTIARKIKQARIDKNMTQPNLADALGVSFQAVSNWERGVNPPLPKYQRMLAKLYGCTVDELLKEE